MTQQYRRLASQINHCSEIYARRTAISTVAAVAVDQATRAAGATGTTQTTGTAGATLVDLWASWQQRWGDTDAVWSLKLANLGNALAYNATALRSARELSPAGGRALTASLRLSF